jgi:tRNA A-37 threonylcarbamoyl transferase component Bud32
VLQKTAFEPGQQVGRYTIRKLLAQGGMAEVYKADQELTGGIFRPVALKVIRNEYSESPDFREMFLDEARCAIGLSHQNIVHIFDVGEAEGLLFMAMELVPGETLSNVARTLREHDGRFTDEALYAIGIYTASALEAVHALKLHDSPVNLVHRDVSPHNLLLSSRGTLKLIDFGIAKAATNRNLTSPGVTKGKAGYFSPEQAMGKALDGRSDLFSLGVTLYKLAYGATPFDQHTSHSERNGALVRGLWEPLHKVQPGLSQGLYDVVARSMRLKPEDRYPTAGEMREALEQAAFVSGFRIGAGCLMGYVSDDGAISTVPTGSRPAMAQVMASAAPAAPPAAAAPPPPVAVRPITLQLPMTISERDRENRERVTDRVMERPRARSSNRWLLGLAFAGAVAIGVGVTIALMRPPAAQPPAVPIARPEPAPPPVAPSPPPPVEPDPDSEPDIEPLPVSVGVTPSPRPRPIRRVVKEPPGPVAESAIPQGEGQLRINIQPANVVTRVVVGRDDWGPAPVNKRVASGRYVVSVKLPDGKKSPEWRGPVMPDMTTVLIYDTETGRWQKH